MVISCETQTLKPEPAIYQTLLEKYSLNPAECLFIDDSPANVEGHAKWACTPCSTSRGANQASLRHSFSFYLEAGSYTLCLEPKARLDPCNHAQDAQ